MNGYFLFWYPFCSSLFMQVGMSGSPLNSQKLLFDVRSTDALDKRSFFTSSIRLLWFSSRWFAQTMCEFPRYKPCSEPAKARKQNEAAF